MQSVSIIITAGGQGKRMGAKVAKQFLEIHGLPVLMTTIKRMHKLLPNAQLVVVLPEADMALWQSLCLKHQFNVQHEVVAGGKERFHSVANGLNHVSNDLVLIHDGVRPLVGPSTIKALLEAGGKHAAVIPVQSMVESLRRGNLMNSEAVDRSQYFTVQTPQLFHTQALKKAYQVDYSERFTDDASVAEAAGLTVVMVPGNPENIKITHPQDLPLAEFLLKQLESQS